MAYYSTLFLLIVTFVTMCFNFEQSVSSECIVFNFGDSNSDIGAASAALGVQLRYPPYGETFFYKSTGRYSNERLYIDFLCEKLNMKFLIPYLESSGSYFRHGANFAVGGMTVDNNVVSIFPLLTQVQQFAHFMSRTRELRPQGQGSLISEEEFRNAIYTIDIGQNDIYYAVKDSDFQTIVHKNIPNFVKSIEAGMKELYRLGGRKFMIFNTSPIGCLPIILAQGSNSSLWQLDEAGCMSVHNDAAKAFNKGLSHMCAKMISELKNAMIVYVDMYSIKYELTANATKYGFESPLITCCGHGPSPYNYGIMCGSPNATVCANPSRRVSWDDIHYTEAANAFVASKIVSGTYSWSSMKLNDLCSFRAEE